MQDLLAAYLRLRPEEAEAVLTLQVTGDLGQDGAARLRRNGNGKIKSNGQDSHKQHANDKENDI